MWSKHCAMGSKHGTIPRCEHRGGLGWGTCCFLHCKGCLCFGLIFIGFSGSPSLELFQVVWGEGVERHQIHFYEFNGDSSVEELFPVPPVSYMSHERSNIGLIRRISATPQCVLQTLDSTALLCCQPSAFRGESAAPPAGLRPEGVVLLPRSEAEHRSWRCHACPVMPPGTAVP